MQNGTAIDARLVPMRLIPAPYWALIALSSFFQLIIFPVAGPLPVWRAGFCWFALSPLLLALMQTRISKPLTIAGAALLAYLCGVLWYMGDCSWIYQTMYLYGGLPKPIAAGILCLFSLYLGLYHALFGVLFSLARRAGWGNAGALLACPFLWVAVELLRARLTGFPWDLLGYAQIDNLLVTRLAPMAGVMALSFLIMSLNAAFAGIFLFRARKRPLVFATVVASAAMLQVCGRFFRSPTNPASTQLAVMLQENLAVGAANREVRPMTESDELDQFSKLSLNPERFSGQPLNGAAGSTEGRQPTVLIWPEAPSHLQSNDPRVLTELASLARRSHAPVIAGGLGVERDSDSSRGYLLFDSAMLLDQQGQYSGRYDKIHLVPWGEFIPFKEFFSFAHKLTEGAGDMDRGHERGAFHAAGHSYGIFICYESIFGNEVREFVRNGAQVLVNISDDGWYGDTGAPWQHLNMARMRAIENSRWVLRSTNTGITTAIDPYGRTIYQAPRHVRGAFVFPFEFRENQTFYTRHGDWFAYCCVAVTVMVIGLGLRQWVALDWKHAE